MGIELRRAADRFVTTYDGVVSRHSFSFGSHYDPGNVGFGVLVCHNDDDVRPGSGYAEHPHRDLEIVTWVLEGELHHRDTTGTSGVIVPGQVQVMSAGTGIRHEELAGEGATRFVQMWVRPDEEGLPPRYVLEEMPAAGPSAGWLTVPGIRSSRAGLHVARVSAGETVSLPDAPLVHLFVCSGTAVTETGAVLGAGDALRARDASGLGISGDAELLVWAMR
jgi:redox-sensitive bicupin YhaK (pirin superfamily)